MRREAPPPETILRFADFRALEAFSSFAPDPDARAFPGGDGLYVLAAAGHGGARLAAQVFRRGGAGRALWFEEGATAQGPGRPPQGPGLQLLGRDGTLRVLPPLEEWPFLADLVTPKCPPPRETAGGRRPAQLKLVRRSPPSSTDGCLLPGGGSKAARAAVSRLEALDGRELRFLRVGATGRLRWIFAPRGFPPDLELPGRRLVNAGTAYEPVLFPADRTPSPRVEARAIRELFGAGEGEGLLWFDTPRGETALIAPASHLVPLDRELLPELL